MISKNDETKVSALGISIWLLASFFFLYEFFLRTFVGTLAHQLLSDLHLTAASFALMGSGYYLAYSIMQVPVGIITSKFGIKRTLAFAIFICALSALAFADADHFISAFTARVLMGFGSSFAFVCLLVICTQWFPQRNFAFLVGSSQFIGTMGPLLAAGPLAWVLTHSGHSWRSLLDMIALLGFVLMAAACLLIKEKSTQRPALVYLSKPQSVKNLLARLLTNPQAWYIAIYSGATYCPIAFLGAFWGTSYLQSHGFTQTQAANIISIAWLGYAIACLGIGLVSDTIRRRKPLLVACATIGMIVTAMITYLPTMPGSLYSLLFFAIGVAAAGQSIGFAAIAEHVDTAVKPTALGLNNCMTTMFSIIVPPISGYFISISAHGHAPAFKPGDFMTGFTIMPVLYLFGLIISAFLIKETYCRPQKEAVILTPSPLISPTTP